MTPVRVAALYDVHGNLAALEAVLAELDDLGVDLVLSGGDVVLGPMPSECMKRLRKLGDRVRFIRGNCEREVLAGSDEDTTWAARTRWSGEQLDEEERDFIAALPETLALEVDGLGAILFCHGSPRKDDEILTRASSQERVREALAGVEESVIVCGNTHVQFDRRVGPHRLVNAGSVGMPYEGRGGAFWALIGPDVSFRRTDYDVEGAAARVRQSGFPEAEEFAREYLLEPQSANEATAFFERMAEKQRASR